jgi:2-polyprenyl-3-methyl-5-hydroxy-6-metoxy-1,4-benzoquinol methylase
VEEAVRFPDGFFHLIFSEEVLEHVEHIKEVAREISRLTRFDGAGVHLFPGSRIIVEPHLFMPFVHWLPKRNYRQLVIAAFLLLRIGPKWPHVDESDLWQASEVYRSYLDEHTHYKDIVLIMEAFRAAGFDTEYESSNSRVNRWAPDCLGRNGFPGGGIALFASKRSSR